MLNLNDRKWKAFFISGNVGIFQIKATKSGIDKNKLLFEGKEEIPYITRSDMSNGINLFIPSVQNKKYSMDKGNCITIGLDTQTVFYQPNDFYTGQNIQVVNYDEMTQFSAQFVISMLKVQMEKFNWGGNGATLGRLSRTKIMLPINEKGEPDYAFMEQFIKEREELKREEYTKYCKEKLVELGEYKKVEDLSSKDWKSFFIVEIFDKIARGKRLKKADHIKGNKPYVSSTAMNNGVDQFIGNDKNVKVYSDCLSLANSGSVGSCFYEPFEFIASDHITHLKKEGINEYTYLFLATMLNRLSEKYNFNREINDKRISREKIYLPCNEKKEPDYPYMEQYIKNIMITKYKSYLNYLNEE